MSMAQQYSVGRAHPFAAAEETPCGTGDHPSQALEIALCFGWIDGQVNSLDGYLSQAFTPRRARSVWSQLNRDSALTLIAEGRMRPAGFFPALTSQNRFAIPFRLDGAKQPEARAAKIATYIGMLECGETLYRQKPRDTPASGACRTRSYRVPPHSL